jgi:integrase
VWLASTTFRPDTSAGKQGVVEIPGPAVAPESRSKRADRKHQRRKGQHLPSRARDTLLGEAVAEQIHAALKAAKVEGYVRPFHDLRHTALTNEAAAGSGPIPLMAKAGHSNMKATQIYLHLAGKVLRGEAAAFERRLLGESEPVESSTDLSESESIERH